ncbi:MAG: PEP-CTERM sorting domain-containing protein [Gammaproteobacteria bacterium]
MKLIQFIGGLLAAAALSSPASAVVFTGATGAGIDVTDYSAASLASFDLDLHQLSGATLNFVLEASDFQSSTLGLNALVRNLSGAGIGQASFSLTGIRFAQAGSVTPAFGQVDSVSHTDSAASIRFGAPEYAEFHFGDPLTLAGKTNWQLDLTGLSAGSRFAVEAGVAEVPEPSSITLLVAGLALLGFGMHRRGK